MADLNNVRIQHTHATEAEWTKIGNGILKAGEFIVYDPDNTHSNPRFKIGDGVKSINELSFVESGSAEGGDVTAAGDNIFTGINTFKNNDFIYSTVTPTYIEVKKLGDGNGNYTFSVNSTKLTKDSLSIQHGDENYLTQYTARNIIYKNGTGTIHPEITLNLPYIDTEPPKTALTIATLEGNNTFTDINSFEKGKIQLKGKGGTVSLYPNSSLNTKLNETTENPVNTNYFIASENAVNVFTSDNTFQSNVIFDENSTIQKKTKKGINIETLNFTFPEAGGTLATAGYVDEIVGDIQTLLADLNGGNGVS